VSTDGRPHIKRRRINAACLTCRKRKTRCSGEQPECKTCTDNGHSCVGYADGPQRKPTVDGKPGGDDGGDDESRSSASSPRKNSQPDVRDARYASQHGPSTLGLKQQCSGDSSSPVRSATREDAGDTRSPGSNHTASSMASARHRVPYFRYFGPTAIVPGFKQMVVQVKDHRRSVNPVTVDSPASAAIGATPAAGQDRCAVGIPIYDVTDPTPNSPLITHLCETFFTHLGCNYPFLQRERFLRDLEDKRVDAILVDAVCAVAARFSSHPLLSSSNDQSIPVGTDFEVKRAFRGHAFAQRARAALIDTFPCPTIAVAQACLLLAYDEFGTDHDSGLWMYLGTSIRMAQDLGIQKIEGLQLEGRIGPTPKTAKHGPAGKEEERRRAARQQQLSKLHETSDPTLVDDRRASEQERIDTFYAIFFLDRAVSSGVGRPVTLRDKDIEISFPHRPDDSCINGWPHPYPVMIRIVHMYGRVADVLNNIKEINQATPEVLKRLAGMEKDLTGKRIPSHHPAQISLLSQPVLPIILLKLTVSRYLSRIIAKVTFQCDKFSALCKRRTRHELHFTSLLVPYPYCFATSTDTSPFIRRQDPTALPGQSGALHVIGEDHCRYTGLR
jgi:Fungal specific transcription factor domain/Fungal Zn(2)-Cys(6) binuclear cluster domain